MSKKKNILTPKLRFSEFVNSEEWEVKNLEEITISENSSLALNKIQLREDGYSVYGADGIVGYIDEFQQKKKYISIVKDGSGVGRLNLCEPKSSILGTLTCIKSKDIKKYTIDWIYYLMNTIDFTLYKKGSGIPHIYYSDFKKEPIPVPQPKEQQKIALCLSSLDEVIEAHSQKLELLQKHKKGLLQNLFPQEGEKAPKLRFKEFENSGEWEEIQLKKVCKYQNGKAHEKDIDGKGNYTVVNSKFISTDGEVVKFSNSAFCLAKIGDILMVLSDVPDGKAIAKCFYVIENNKYTVNQRICRITPKNISDVLLFYILNRNSYYLKFDDGVKQTNLKKEDVLNCPIFVPQTLDEQQKIASCLSSLDNLITAQVEKIEQLQQHKKGLMQGLFPKMDS